MMVNISMTGIFVKIAVMIAKNVKDQLLATNAKMDFTYILDYAILALKKTIAALASTKILILTA